MNEPEKSMIREIRDAFDGASVPSSEWTAVRRRLERTVWRIERQGMVLFLKLQTYRAFKVKFRYAFKMSPLSREARWLMKLDGFPCLFPEPLLHGEEGKGFSRKRSVLVTRGIRGKKAVEALEDLDFGLVASAIKEFAKRKILHPDLHLNNMIVAGDKIGVLDLQSLGKRPFVSFSSLCIRMALKVAASLEGGSFEEWLDILEREGILGRGVRKDEFLEKRRRIKRREFNKRIKRCLVNSSGFEVFKTRGARIYMRRSAERRQVLDATGELSGPEREGILVARNGLVVYASRKREGTELWKAARILELSGGRDLLPIALVAGKGRSLVVFGPEAATDDAREFLEKAGSIARRKGGA